MRGDCRRSHAVPARGRSRGATIAHAAHADRFAPKPGGLCSRAGGRQRPRTPARLHAAKPARSWSGTVQRHAALPARVALLRRFGRRDAPDVCQIALADAPIFMFEVCTSAVLAARCVHRRRRRSPPGRLIAMIARRRRDRSAALRLAYLPVPSSAPRRRASPCSAEPGPAARPIGHRRLRSPSSRCVRTWLVLIGFGLPSGPGRSSALRPLLDGSRRAAAARRSGHRPDRGGRRDREPAISTGAAAAGMVIGTSTVLAVLLYAGACWMWARAPHRADSRSSRTGRGARPAGTDGGRFGARAGPGRLAPFTRHSRQGGPQQRCSSPHADSQRPSRSKRSYGAPPARRGQRAAARGRGRGRRDLRPLAAPASPRGVTSRAHATSPSTLPCATTTCASFSSISCPWGSHLWGDARRG